MEYQKAMRIYRRMCNSFRGLGCCGDCPLNPKNNSKLTVCILALQQHPDIVEPILEKWDREHPERTILDEFLEHYPDAPLSNDGTPNDICPHNLGYDDIEDCDGACAKCWSQTPEEAKKKEGK